MHFLVNWTLLNAARNREEKPQKENKVILCSNVSQALLAAMASIFYWCHSYSHIALAGNLILFGALISAKPVLWHILVYTKVSIANLRMKWKTKKLVVCKGFQLFILYIYKILSSISCDFLPPISPLPLMQF